MRKTKGNERRERKEDKKPPRSEQIRLEFFCSPYWERQSDEEDIEN